MNLDGDLTTDGEAWLGIPPHRSLSALHFVGSSTHRVGVPIHKSSVALHFIGSSIDDNIPNREPLFALASCYLVIDMRKAFGEVQPTTLSR